MTEPRHPGGIESGAATEVEQAAAGSEHRVQPAPHLGAHVLNCGIVAAVTVIIRSDVVEGATRLMQLQQHTGRCLRSIAEPTHERSGMRVPALYRATGMSYVEHLSTPPLGELAARMRIALVVPGGVDRSGVYRVIPALLALLSRLSRAHEVHAFALAQEAGPADWQLAGAHIHNIGRQRTRTRAVRAILAVDRASHFDLVHAIWSGSCGLVAVAAAALLRIPTVVHVAGGELVALPEIGYGDMLTWRSRMRERLTLRAASVVSAASAPVVAAVAALGVGAERVPLGVDLSVWPPRAPVRRDGRETAKLIHVASLNRVKDQRTLLQALATLAQRGIDFHMDIVGEDTLAGEMRTP